MHDGIKEQTHGPGVKPQAARNSGLLIQAELAERWRLSVRTLEKWRTVARGPRHLKLGRRVYYRIEDVEAFEASHLRGGKDL